MTSLAQELPPKPVLVTKPIYRKRRFLPWLVWCAPLAAAVVASFYGKAYFDQQGQILTLRVSSAEGLKVSDTPLLHLGVSIGRVTDIRLAPDQKSALVEIRVERHHDAFLKEGAEFWIVRPEVSATALQGLGTLLSGPYIDSKPGTGKTEHRFLALRRAPSPFEDGLSLIVHSARSEDIGEDSPVYYRGVQVGWVSKVTLGRLGNQVDIRLVIWKRYKSLVRAGSKFWSVSGLEVKGGIFSGLELNMSSLKSLVAGGIAFATPEKDMGPPARSGKTFTLESKVKDEWRGWAPLIPLPPETVETEETDESQSINPLKHPRLQR